VPLKFRPIPADAYGMSTNTETNGTDALSFADAALSDVERIVRKIAGDLPAHVMESLMCAVETYGDARSDAALSTDAV
jgi:hypothetical protein